MLHVIVLDNANFFPRKASFFVSISESENQNLFRRSTIIPKLHEQFERNNIKLDAMWGLWHLVEVYFLWEMFVSTGNAFLCVVQVLDCFCLQSCASCSSFVSSYWVLFRQGFIHHNGNWNFSVVLYYATTCNSRFWNHLQVKKASMK